MSHATLSALRAEKMSAASSLDESDASSSSGSASSSDPESDSSSSSHDESESNSEEITQEYLETLLAKAKENMRSKQKEKSAFMEEEIRLDNGKSRPRYVLLTLPYHFSKLLFQRAPVPGSRGSSLNILRLRFRKEGRSTPSPGR